MTSWQSSISTCTERLCWCDLAQTLGGVLREDLRIESEVLVIDGIVLVDFGMVVRVPPLDDRVPRPDAVIGYPVGSRFTHWERIAAYFEAVISSNPIPPGGDPGQMGDGPVVEIGPGFRG